MTEEKLTYTPAEYLGIEVPYPFRDFKRVRVYTHRIYGCCPVSVEGDEWVFEHHLRYDENKVSYDVSNFLEGHARIICGHSLHTMKLYVSAMCFGVNAVDMGIAKSGEDGYVICSAWGPPTCEAVVVYRLHPEPIEKGYMDRYYEHLAKVGHVAVPDFYFNKFASAETKAKRERQVKEWRKAGSPKFWEGWRNPPCQPQPRGK